MLAALALLGGAQSRLPLPPPMPLRPIQEDRSTWQGELHRLTDGDLTLELYIPTAWNPSKEKGLWIHFHCVAWHMVQEHVLRGIARPMLVFNNGQGSSVYQRPFQDRTRLLRWLDIVSETLGQRVVWVEITSFSAGYGAVREIVQNPEDTALVRRIVLFDSMYASFEREGSREPSLAQVGAFLPFARLAMAGEKTFVFTFSQVPTETYASSGECAASLVSRLGGSLTPVPPGTLAATLDSQFPLQTRFDLRNLHVWGYGGSDAAAHLTHVRHINRVMANLDLVGLP